MMNINIQSRGFSTTASLRNYTERRLRLALSWANCQLRKVTVRFSDENGPKGGKDKRCVIQLGLTGGQDVLVRDTESDLYVAIDRAVDRAARTVARQLKRQQQYQRDTWQCKGNSGRNQGSFPDIVNGYIAS